MGLEGQCKVCGKRDCPCPICHGLGRVYVGDFYPGHPQFGKTVLCECSREVVRREFFEGELRRLSGISMLGEDYRQVTFESYDVSWSGEYRHQICLTTALMLVKAIACYPLWPQSLQGQIPFLTLSGPTGSGKTLLAAAAYNYRTDPLCSLYDDLDRKGIDYQPGAAFLLVPEMMDWLRASFNANNRDGTVQERLGAIQSAPFLVLDDLGMENQTGFAEERLDMIINHRYMHHLPLIVTTNCAVRDLSDRIASRLSAGLVQVMDLPDFRLEGPGGLQADEFIKLWRASS